MLRKILYILLTIVAVWCMLCQFVLMMKVPDVKARIDFDKAGIPVHFVVDTFAGRHLHYAVTGSDTLPTLVFIHGSPGSWRDYKKYMLDSSLRSKFRIVAVDRAGFGESDYTHAANLQQNADLIQNSLTKIYNGKPLYLIGHSYGGPIVALLAGQHPEHITGIVILAGAVDLTLETPERWRYVLNVPPFRYLVPVAMRTSNEELMDLKKDLVPLKALLPNFKGDVFVFHGEKDMLVDVHNADFIKASFTNARSMHVTLFPKENHFIPWTRFEEIRDSLKKLPSDAIL